MLLFVLCAYSISRNCRNFYLNEVSLILIFWSSLVLEKYLSVHAYVEAGVLVSREYLSMQDFCLLSCKELKSVVKFVIQSTGRLEFENGVLLGVNYPVLFIVQACTHLFEKCEFFGVWLYWAFFPEKNGGSKHFLPYTGQKSEGPRPSPGPLSDYITVLFPAFMPSCLGKEYQIPGTST